MNMITLVQMDESKFPWNGIYFHGQCEDFVNSVIDQGAGDLVGSIEVENPPFGKYEVDVYGKTAIAYVWLGAGGDRIRGLIVFPDDEQGMIDANSSFLENKKFL